MIRCRGGLISSHVEAPDDDILAETSATVGGIPARATGVDAVTTVIDRFSISGMPSTARAEHFHVGAGDLYTGILRVSIGNYAFHH